MREFIAKMFIKSISRKTKVFVDTLHGTACNPYENAIRLNLEDTSPLYDGGFLHHLAVEHKCSFVNEISLPLWTILHELGHLATEDECEDESEYLARELLNIDGTELANKAYFNLESEWRATEWAIEYAKKHPFKCIIFGDLLR